MAALVFDPKRKAFIPAGIAALGAGKDAYLRKLTNTCNCCGAPFVLDTSDGSGEICGDCFDLGGIENEISDCGSTPALEAEAAALKAAIVAKGGVL